jgi:nicotinate phosphoribosyltransferase
LGVRYIAYLQGQALANFSSYILKARLDEAGLTKCKIFATNSLDEYIISDLERQNAAIDAYGVGDAIATSKHNPCFGNVYKLVQIGDEPVLKRSEDKSKIINPGFQITYRIIKNGSFRADVTCLRGDLLSSKIERGEEFTIQSEFDDTKTSRFAKGDYSFRILQNLVMKEGVPVNEKYSIKDARNYYKQNLESLNPTERRIINPHYYKVDISDDLYNLKIKIINSLIKEIKNYE